MRMRTRAAVLGVLGPCLVVGLCLADVCRAVVFTQPAWKMQNNASASQFGWAVNSAGDVNNDGFDDVIVGAPHFRTNLSVPTNDGQVQIFHGSATGLSLTAARTFVGAVGARKGISVASAGDVNNDGFDDVIIGSDFVGSGVNGPRFEVYHGSPTGIGPTPARTVTGPLLSELGYSVNCAGDVNNDGFDDVIVGQHDYNSGGQTGEGRASVYLGSATGIAAAPVWAVESNLPNTLFGVSVDGAGDVNGDGFDDVIVGHYRFGAGGQQREGRALVYLGSASGPALTPAWTVESNQAFAEYGVTVAGAGDVNNDGFDDVTVGAWQWDGAFADSGHAWVYLGSPAGLSGTATWQFDGENVIAGLGWTVAGVGDMNNDGFDDVAAGSSSYGTSSAPPQFQGRAYVFYGRASGVEPTPSRIYQSDQADAYAGRGLGAAGDVDNDGFGDLAMGAYFYNGGQGRAYVHRGSATLPTYTFQPLASYPNQFFSNRHAVPNERLELGLSEETFLYYQFRGKTIFADGSGSGAGQFSNPVLRGIDANGTLMFHGFYDSADPRSSGIELWHRLTGTKEIFSRLTAAGGYLENPAINDLGDVAFVDQDGSTGNLRLFRNFTLEPSLAACTQMTQAVLNDAGALAFSCGNFSTQSIHLGTASPFPVAVDANSFSPADPGGNTALGIDASGTLAFVHFGNALGGLFLKHPATPPVLLDPIEACFSYVGFNDQGRVLCTHDDSVRVLAEPSVVQSHEVANKGMLLDGVAISSTDFNSSFINDLGQVTFTARLSDGKAAIYLATPTSCDTDLDGLCDVQDNCTATPNRDQRDFDGDGIGNACDNCPLVKNADQLDSNGDSRGDACLPCNASGTTLPLCGTVSVPAGSTTFSIPNIPIETFPDRPILFGSARSNTPGLAVDARFAAVPYGDNFAEGCAGGNPHLNSGGAFPSHVDSGYSVEIRLFDQFVTDADRAGATCSLEFTATGVAGTYHYVVDTATDVPIGPTYLTQSTGAPVSFNGGDLPGAIPFIEEASNHRFLYAGTGGSSFGTCHWDPDPPGTDDSPEVVYSGATATGWDCCTFQFDGADGVPSAVGQLVLDLNGPLPPPDPDGDGFLSPCDSCDYINDISQADRGGVGAGTPGNGIGDACECGEITNDGRVDAADVTLLRQRLANIGPALTPAQLARCAVIGNSATCNVRTVVAMRRAVAVPSLPPFIQPVCTAALPP